jgi:hypothetical protein
MYLSTELVGLAELGAKAKNTPTFTPDPAFVLDIVQKTDLPMSARQWPRVHATDHDHHPYTRFFRGRFDNARPIVHARHAGTTAVCAPPRFANTRARK